MDTPTQLLARFSPGGGCLALLLELLDAATRSLHVMQYQFSSPPLTDALIRAHGRGISIKIILDHMCEHDRDCDAGRLMAVGQQVLLDHRHRIFHNKVCVIDAAHVLTGSYNWSRSAEYENAENLLYLANVPALAAAYIQAFDGHAHHAVLCPPDIPIPAHKTTNPYAALRP